MQDTLKPVPTPDNLFHDGNPASGELGTIVGADWLNSAQSAIQSTQQEVLAVLKDSGQTADPKRQDQLLQAVKKIAWGGNAKPSTLAGYGIADGLTLRPQLGDRVDLNNIVEDGLYHNPGDGYAANGANYPAAQAGLLFVYSDGAMVYQQYQCYANAGCWYRCRYSGNWQPWRKLADAATTLAGYGIADAQPLNNNLTALANLGTTGLMVDTGPGTAVTRSIVAGQGVTVSNGDGKAGNPTIALVNSGVAAGTYGMVAVDAMGRVAAGRAMTAADVPALDWSKITSGTPTTLGGYGITDAANSVGDSAKPFLVAPATLNQHAVPLGQLLGGLKGLATFLLSDTFVVPANITKIYISGCAGGGGGGGSGVGSTNYMAAAGGGGAGQSIIRQAFSVTPGQALTLSIGAAGFGGTGGIIPSVAGQGSQGNSGGAGGNTSIPQLSLVLKGGGGGGGSDLRLSSTWGNGAGPASGGAGWASGTIGWSGATGSICYPGGIGGTSPFGAGGNTIAWFWGGGTSTAGCGYGSGGGGGFAQANTPAKGIDGASGAPGVLFIEW